MIPTQFVLTSCSYPEITLLKGESGVVVGEPRIVYGEVLAIQLLPRPPRKTFSVDP